MAETQSLDTVASGTMFALIMQKPVFIGINSLINLVAELA